MGKATIVSGGADGLYSVRLDYGKATQTASLTAIAARLAELVGLLAAALDDLNLQEYAQAALVAEVEAAIAAFVAAAQALPVAQQAATVASSNNQVVAASTTATPEEKAAAAEALVLANAALKAAEEAYQATLKAHTEALKKLAESNRKTAPLKLAFDLLKAEQTQLKKDQAKWAALVLEETLPAWCADLTEDATGEVATVEIPGESKRVLIAPAAPAHVPARDGVLSAREVQTPAQVFWNAAVLPGWQKYKPTFRRGTITDINHETDTASVTLEPGDVSSAQALGINQATTLAAVPVVYMGCNAGAFEVGDKCVVQFTGQDWTQPKVVGFVDNPKSCVSYEFYTSEPIFPTTVSTGEYTGGLGSFGVSGSGVIAKPSNANAKPLFSSFLAPDTEDPKWTLRDKDYIISTNEEPVGSNFKTTYSWQHQKLVEYANWPNNSRLSLVTSTAGMASGRNSMANWDSPSRESALGNQFTWLHDEGIDVPPAYYDKTGAYAGMPVYESDGIWPRHAAVQVSGGRKFFICTDNKGRFQIYPVKAYPLSGGRRFVENYWLETPPYPAWVTVPDPNDSGVRLHEWHWAFNKDATKAVSCPFNSVPSDLLIVAEDPARAPSLNFGLRANLALLPEEAALLDAGLTTMAGRNDTPGLVEFGIAITVTGPGEMDFTVAFTLLRNQYALVGNRYFFDAAYSLVDKGDNGLMTWEEDTLVTAEVQVFVAPGNYAAGPLAMITPVVTPAVFTHNANLPVGYVVISTNDNEMTPTERLKLQAMASDGAFLTTAGFQRNFGPSAVADGSGNHERADVGHPDNYGTVRGFTRQSTYGLTTISVDHLGPNPCVLSALPLQSTPAPNSANIEPSSAILLRALELRTMSLQYELLDNRAGLSSRILMAYNEVVLSRPQALLAVGVGPDRAVLATERVPCSAVAHHNAVINLVFWTGPDRGFSIHPDGHWGYSAGPSASSDIVNVKSGNGSKRTTHRALFNKAFGQAREYDYYVAPNPGSQTAENYKEYAAYRLGYLGGFKTSGIWITF